jgi:tRNA-uridine 2-sulfurtransferase
MPSTSGVKAIGLLSGGLDSTLAVKLIIDQGIDVVAFNMITPFCTCTRKGCSHEASCVADRFGVPIKVVAVGQEYIKMVKQPTHGYGSNMNPCIDCRILLFQKAKAYMDEIGAQFIFTGEVLGQRPMSQHKRAMMLIDKESGLQGLVVRPLSARHLPSTIPEEKGWVDRDRLLDIQGRRRLPQIDLAKSLNITDYPCPAGGCRLTDPNYTKKIKDAFEHNEHSLHDIHCLKYGRHFRLASGAKVIVGRNKDENEMLLRHSEDTDVIIEILGTGSPVVLLKKMAVEEDRCLAIGLCLRYSDATAIEDLCIKIRDETGHEAIRQLVDIPLVSEVALSAAKLIS